MDIKTDPNLLPVASILEDLERAEGSQYNLTLYASWIVIVLRICLPGSPVQYMKRLCIKYNKLNAQLPAVPGNKTSGTVTSVDISKIDEVFS